MSKQEELYKKAIEKQQKKRSEFKSSIKKKASYLKYNVCLALPEEENKKIAEMLDRVLRNNFPKLKIDIRCGSKNHIIGLETDGEFMVFNNYIAGLIKAF